MPIDGRSLGSRERALAAVDCLHQVLAADQLIQRLPVVAPGLIQLVNHSLAELIADVEACEHQDLAVSR